MKESKYWAENGKLHRWAYRGFDTIPLRASRIVKELRKQENQLAAKDAEIAKLREALESASTALVFTARDNSLNHRDAWIWGILVGWGDSLPQVARKHNWDKKTVERLKRLRKAVEATK